MKIWISAPAIFPECTACAAINPALKTIMDYATEQIDEGSSAIKKVMAKVDCHESTKVDMGVSTETKITFFDKRTASQLTEGLSVTCPGMAAQRLL